MPKRFVASMLAAVFALFAAPAGASLDPPYITPAQPRAGDEISVSIHGGECDAPYVGIDWPPPVTRQGSVTTIHLIGYHETNPELCYITVATRSDPLGTYAAGAYTLVVEWRYASFSGAWIEETLGVIPFTVSGEIPPTGPPPHPLPL